MFIPSYGASKEVSDPLEAAARWMVGDRSALAAAAAEGNSSFLFARAACGDDSISVFAKDDHDNRKFFVGFVGTFGGGSSSGFWVTESRRSRGSEIRPN